MRKLTDPRPQNRVRRPVAELIADGVVAAYIHQISTRHGADSASEPTRSEPGRAELLITAQRLG